MNDIVFHFHLLPFVFDYVLKIKGSYEATINKILVPIYVTIKYKLSKVILRTEMVYLFEGIISEKQMCSTASTDQVLKINHIYLRFLLKNPI